MKKLTRSRAQNSSSRWLIVGCLFIIAACAVRMHAAVEIQSYRYERELSKPKASWHSIRLSQDIVARCQTQLHDLRIIAFSTQRDSVEIPYLLRTSVAQNRTEERDLDIVDLSKIPTGLSFKVANDNAQDLNAIRLDFDEQSFDYRVRVEGSDDRQTWNTIVDSAQIVAIDNDYYSYCYSTVHFPSTRFRLLRLTLLSPTAKAPNSVVCWHEVHDPGAYNDVHIAKQGHTIDPRRRLSTIDLAFNTSVALSSIQLLVNDAIDYLRPLRIYRIGDTIASRRGGVIQRTLVYSGTLYSRDEHTFRFTTEKGQYWQVEVDNNDNQALHFGNCRARCVQSELIARFPPMNIASLALVYGSTSANAPQYDLEAFADRIPKSCSELKLGDERDRSSEAKTESGPLFQNPLWLWIVMAGIIALVGYSTLRMLSRNAKTNKSSEV